jgi:hypothetical protein
MKWIDLAYSGEKWQDFVKAVMSLLVSQMENLLSVCQQEFCFVGLVYVAVGGSVAACVLFRCGILTEESRVYRLLERKTWSTRQGLLQIRIQLPA